MIGWLTLAGLLHLIAIALWLGGMVFFLVVLGPAVHDLEPRIAIHTLNRARMGLETISWVAIALLLATGVFNLLLRVSASGTAPSEFYIVMLSVKIFFFLAMVTHHCLQVFKYAPTIADLSARVPHGADAWPEPLLAQWRRWFLLLKINLTLGPIAVLLGLNLVKT